jgi:F0F1-type ATP synthase membrane subunit b/b'
MTRRAPRVLLIAITAIVLFAGSAWAAEEGGGRENLFIAPVGWLFRWIHFIIIFGGAGYLIAKKAPAFFRSRAEKIVASITESARVKDEAARKLKEAEEKLARLDQELAELRQTAQREAAAEGERLRALAQDEAQKIERAAQMEIQAAERAARMELKALAARLAVERAEVVIRQQLTPQTEAAILQSFVQNLGRGAN